MFSKFSLKHKILTGGLLPLALIVVINIVGLMNFNSLINSFEWVEHTHEVIEKAIKIEKAAVDMETGERGFLLTGEEQFLEPYTEWSEQYDTLIKELAEMVQDNPQQSALLLQAQETIDEWRNNVAEHYIAERKRLNPVNKIEALNTVSQHVATKAGKKYFDTFRQQMNTFRAHEKDLLKQRSETMGNLTSKTNLIIILGTAAAIVLAILISLFLIKTIIVPVNSLKEKAFKISQGDIDLNFDIDSNDELGKLGEAFKVMSAYIKEMSDVAHTIGKGNLAVEVNSRTESDVLGNALKNMVINLNNIMRELKESTVVLGSASSEILATTSQVSSSANQTSSAVAETSSSVEEIKQTAKLSSSKATHTAESTEKTMDIAKEGIHALGENMEGLNQIKEKMDLMASNIIQLSEQGQMIGEIITTVEDIANQSNLLAVNASIEAVKAGEHGKGFSVVAQELKNLADQSKQGTKQVQSILSDIQKATGTLVMVAEQGGKAVENGVQQAQNAKKSMDMLNNSVLGAAKASKQIAVSYEQELSGMDQIAAAMGSIKDATTQNVSSITQVEESVRNLNSLSEKLKELLGRYTTAQVQ